MIEEAGVAALGEEPNQEEERKEEEDEEELLGGVEHFSSSHWIMANGTSIHRCIAHRDAILQVLVLDK